MIASIQSLRAVAALLVVLVHCEALLARVGLGPVAWMGGTGVDLFFVVSGFIMVRTTDRAVPVGPAAFLKNRVARVVPSYWLLTLLVFALALAAPRLFAGTEASLPNLARSLGFLPYARGDGQMRPILFVGWSLNYEMLFYLVFAASLALPGRRRQLVAAAAAIAALVIAGRWRAGFPPALAFWTAPVMIEFVCGMLLACAYPRLPERPSRAVWGIVLAVGAAALLGSAWLGALAGALFYNPVFTGVAATLVVAAAIALERAGAWPRWRPLAHLGDASYAMYLTHPLVTVAVLKLGDRLGLGGPLLALPLLVATFALVCAVALAYYRWIETPLSAAARRVLAPAERQRAGGL